MLTHLLRAQDCAACRLCCHFQRSSAWETPAIEPELVALYRELNPPPPLMERVDGSITFALRFPPDDASAEAPCPMLDASSGCTLPREQRPFECRLWPLRLMRVREDECGMRPAAPDACRRTERGGSAPGKRADGADSAPLEHPSERVVIGCYSACPGVPTSLLPRLREEALGPLRAALAEHARRLPQTIRPYDAHYVILAELPELSEAGLSKD